MLPVNIRNIDSFDSFKAHQKKAMKENGLNFFDMLCCVSVLQRVFNLFNTCARCLVCDM